MGAIGGIMKFVSPIMGLVSAFGGMSKPKSAPVGKPSNVTTENKSAMMAADEEARKKRLLAMNASGAGPSQSQMQQTAAPVTRKTLFGQ